VASPLSLFERLAGHPRAWVAGHGLFVPLTHGESRLDTRIGEATTWFGLRTLLSQACATRSSHARIPTFLILSTCEAAETSRRGYLTDFMNLTYSASAIGIPLVMAPKWPLSAVSDERMRELISREGSVSTAAHAMLRSAYERWRECRDTRAIPRITRSCIDGRTFTLGDLGALTLHGYIQEPEGIDI
jgi:hypothetical protein